MTKKILIKIVAIAVAAMMIIPLILGVFLSF